MVIKSKRAALGLLGYGGMFCCGLSVACGSGGASEAGLIEASELITPVEPNRQYAEQNGTSAPPHSFEELPELVGAQIEVDGDALVVTLDNTTGVAGSVRVSTVVDTAQGLFYTPDAVSQQLGAEGQTVLRLLPGSVSGLDLANEEWTDARVSLEYFLDDGRQSGSQVSAFTEYGVLTEPYETVSSGKAYGMPPRDVLVDENVEKQAATFSVCFDHVVTLTGNVESGIDFFKQLTNTVSAAGMRLEFTAPGAASSIRNLDLSGCTTFPRTVGSWSFTPTTLSVGFPVSGAVIQAVKSTGFLAKRQLAAQTVTATTSSLGRLPFSMTTGEDANLQTMFVLAQQTLRRAMSLGTVVNTNDVLTLKVGPRTEYLHEQRTVTATSGATRQRGAIAHETGHWIHRAFLSVPLAQTGSQSNYCTPGGSPSCTLPPADGCARSPSGGHGQLNIEWESLAHLEGIADFFRVLAYNDAPLNANCTMPDALAGAPASLVNCEGPGLYLKTGATGGGRCFEFGKAIANSVSDEYDWTKMYWDLFADETGLGNARLRSYLLVEQAVTSWGVTDHLDKILAAAGTDMRAAINRAAVGNLVDGAAH